MNLHFVDPQGHDLRYSYCGDSREWRGDSNAAFFREAQVPPGAIAHYDLRICGQPGYEGPATVRLQSVMEGVAHFGSVYPVSLRFRAPSDPAIDVSARLFNADDDQESRDWRQRRRVGESKTLSLGRLDDQDRITWAVRNGAYGYAWGFELIANGRVAYSDVDGEAGIEGANGNDQSHQNRLVRRVVLTPTGQVLESYETTAGASNSGTGSGRPRTRGSRRAAPRALRLSTRSPAARTGAAGPVVCRRPARSRPPRACPPATWRVAASSTTSIRSGGARRAAGGLRSRSAVHPRRREHLRPATDRLEGPAATGCAALASARTSWSAAIPPSVPALPQGPLPALLRAGVRSAR